MAMTCEAELLTSPVTGSTTSNELVSKLWIFQVAEIVPVTLILKYLFFTFVGEGLLTS